MKALLLQGGRKWKGFLLVLLLIVLLVVGGYITDQTIIRDLVLGLFAILGTSTAAEKFSGQKERAS